jgi:hypothetical protein
LFDTGGFEKSDIEDMSKSLLRVVATVPTIEELKDIFSMMKKG